MDTWKEVNYKMNFYVYSSAYNISKSEKLPVLFSSPDHTHFYYETIVI